MFFLWCFAWYKAEGWAPNPFACHRRLVWSRHPEHRESMRPQYSSNLAEKNVKGDQELMNILNKLSRGVYSNRVESYPSYPRQNWFQHLHEIWTWVKIEIEEPNNCMVRCVKNEGPKIQLDLHTVFFVRVFPLRHNHAPKISRSQGWKVASWLSLHNFQIWKRRVKLMSLRLSKWDGGNTTIRGYKYHQDLHKQQHVRRWHGSYCQPSTVFPRMFFPTYLALRSFSKAWGAMTPPLASGKR